jgi:PTH1 family peptidyl-tRNA hydrolase
MSLKCVLGLGNPGEKYTFTRHNIGFLCLDYLTENTPWSSNSKLKSLTTTFQDLKWFKPQNFMNLSGDSTIKILNYYGFKPEEILVIHDDIDLDVGKIKLKSKGGHGGHNGIRNIIDCLGTSDFHRLRIGVGRPNYNVSEYVLKEPSKDEQIVLENSFIRIRNNFNKITSLKFDKITLEE